MTDTPSFQDLLDDFADEVFVGRSEQLSLFEDAIKATKPSFLILNISGQGGVGKSTLLERYRGISKSNDVAYAIVNEDHLTIPKILETFVEQLEKDGLDFDHFNERYRKYQDLKERVEADPKVPSGLMDFALRGIAKVGVKSLKRIPIAGDVADVFLSPESEEVIVDQASEFTKYIFQKFTNKDERVLLLETDSELTKYFLEDLTKALKSGKAVLSFDTYEKTSASIEKWLVDLLLGEFGQFSSNVLFVIAGRYSLGQNWTRFRKAIRQVELQEFTEEEAKDYLTRSGITDEKLISQFIEISEGLPVLLALLVSSPNQLPHDVSGDAVQRFLQGLTSEQREAALISSLPRYFNSDILASLLGDEAGKNAFGWLSQAHFVRTSENGWVYHDVVRLMMLRYFRMRSNQQFAAAHKLLEKFYKNLASKLDGTEYIKNTNNQLKVKFEAETLYHFLCQNPDANVEYIARLFASELRNTLECIAKDSVDLDRNEKNLGALIINCFNVLSQLSDEITDSLIKEWADKYRILAVFFSETSTDIKNILDSLYWLSTVKTLNNEEKSFILSFIGYLRYLDYQEKSDLLLALNDLNKSIQLNSPFYALYIFRGQTYDNMGNNVAALSDFSKVLEEFPNNSYSYYLRGQTYKKIKDYPNALTDFSKAIELQPDDGSNYYQRGLTYSDMTDYPAALVDFTKAIELLPEKWYIYFLRGKTYSDMKDYSSALADLTKVIELQPENGDNYNWRGGTYYEMKDYPASLSDYSKAIELQPDDGSNYYQRGRTYSDMTDYPAALVDFTKAIELLPEKWYIYFFRGKTYSDMKDYSSALADFTKVIELQPENGDNYNWRGGTYYQMKDYPASLSDYSKAIELQPENGDKYYWRGRTYYQMKDYSNALTDFSKAIELQPEDGNNYHWRGRTHNEMQDYPNALNDFTKAVELQPEEWYIYNWRGGTYYEMKDYPASLSDYSKAIELQPEDGGSHYWRGRTYRQIKDYSNAFNDFSKAIELEPEDGNNYFWRALCQYDTNNQNKYKEDVQTALQLFKANYEDNKEPHISFRMALCLFANEGTDEAKKLYQETVNQCFDKNDLSNALRNLEEITDLIGKTAETELVVNLLSEALTKFS